MLQLLNPSSASAGLKHLIETPEAVMQAIPFKPFFGFGWIETLPKYNLFHLGHFLLNPSSASAGLKRSGVNIQFTSDFLF